MRKLATLLSLLASTGCGVNVLDGSLSEAYDLAFSDVKVQRGQQAMAVTYLAASGNETVAKLTVDLSGVALSGGGSINLAEDYAPGHPRATVTRAMQNEPVLVLPQIDQGQLSLSAPPDPGNTISGSFHILFGQGGDLGAGRTLDGKFTALVEATDG